MKFIVYDAEYDRDVVGHSLYQQSERYDRFGAVAMDEGHLANAVRYVSLNPVRARLVSQPKDWQWSSVAAHLAGQDDGLVRVARCWIAMAHSLIFWGRRRTMPRHGGCSECRKPQAGRWAMTLGWTHWKREPGAY